MLRGACRTRIEKGGNHAKAKRTHTATRRADTRASPQATSPEGDTLRAVLLHHLAALLVLQGNDQLGQGDMPLLPAQPEGRRPAVSWETCPAKVSGRFVDGRSGASSRVQFCGTCSLPVLTNQDGRLRKHRRHVLTPHIQSRAFNMARR